MEVIKNLIKLAWTILSTVFWFTNQTIVRTQQEIIPNDFNARTAGENAANAMFDDEVVTTEPKAIKAKA